MNSKTYKKLTDEELEIYKEAMYNYSSLTQDLFCSLFEKNYDWTLFGDPYQDYENGIAPEGELINENYDNTHTKLNTMTWILNKLEQKNLLDRMNQKKFSKERIKEYSNGFPYISAIVIYVGYPTTEMFGFYPYKLKQ